MLYQPILFFILDSKPQQSWNWLIPLFTFVAGLLFGLIQKKWDENKALERYEYSFVVDILDIFNNEDKPSDEILTLKEREKKNPLYFQIKHYETISTAINNGLKDKKDDQKNLENLKEDLENKFKGRFR